MTWRAFHKAWTGIFVINWQTLDLTRIFHFSGNHLSVLFSYFRYFHRHMLARGVSSHWHCASCLYVGGCWCRISAFSSLVLSVLSFCHGRALCVCPCVRLSVCVCVMGSRRSTQPHLFLNVMVCKRLCMYRKFNKINMGMDDECDADRRIKNHSMTSLSLYAYIHWPCLRLWLTYISLSTLPPPPLLHSLSQKSFFSLCILFACIYILVNPGIPLISATILMGFMKDTYCMGWRAI